MASLMKLDQIESGYAKLVVGGGGGGETKNHKH